MFVLDTDTLSLLLRNQEKVAGRVRQIGNTAPLAITVITRIEMLQGRFSAILKAADSRELLQAAERLRQTEHELSKLQRIVDLDEQAAEWFDRLRGNKKLKKIGRPDPLIACIALTYDLTLVTRNVKDFQNVPGLRVENWAD